jgi:two-component system sensor histidine kinase PilS (NtrC family)
MITTLNHKKMDEGLIVELVRVSLYLVVLVVGLLSYLFQPGFINWSFLGPFYGLITIGFALHLLIVAFLEKIPEHPRALFASFVIDSLLISLLIYYSGVNQSLFLFLHLVSILLAGLVFRSSGALIIALFTSIFFSVVTIFSPEMKAMNFLFLLALNNVAFFTVAGLSGYLSEQLQSVGRELTKTGANLKAFQDLHRVILENMPTGMVSFDRDGRILQTNSAAKQIFHRENLEQENWFHLLPEFKIASGPNKADLRYKAPSGEDQQLLGVTVSSLYHPAYNDQIQIALIEDITKMRQLEYSTRQNEKLAAIGGLAAGIAHEIRNPLAGISGSIEMLSQTVAVEDDRKLMKIVLREIDRLNNLITEFLEFASPEKPPTDKVSLKPLLLEVLDSMQMNAKLRTDVSVQKSFDDQTVILGHRDKLKQALLNIILNSYQAMQDVNNPSLEVSAKSEKGEVVVRVRDSGSGMSETTRKRMFEAFHTTKPKGTGLGLAITHKILEGHGARIFVESEQGRGTEFVLHFPSAQSEIKAVASQESQ